MQIEESKKQYKEPTLIFVEAVAMPQGEVICRGKTIGWIDSETDPIPVYVKI